jgi:hypothetical protein
MEIAIKAEARPRTVRQTDAIGKLNEVVAAGSAARRSWRVENLAHTD